MLRQCPRGIVGVTDGGLFGKTIQPELYSYVNELPQLCRGRSWWSHAVQICFLAYADPLKPDRTAEGYRILGGGTIFFLKRTHPRTHAEKREKTGMGGGGGAGAQIQAIGNPLVGRAALLCDTQLTAHVRAALTERIGQN